MRVSTDPGRSTVPPAVRTSAPGWRDPRLWIGVAIVAASVLVGVRVLASADDSVAVWSVAGDVGAGDRLDEGDLVTTRVRFSDDVDLEHYFTVDDALPDDLRLVRGLGAGELLPRTAIGTDDDAGLVEISLAVGPLQVPPAVGPGSVVDVYVADAGDTPEVEPVGGGAGDRRPDDAPAPAEPALPAVSVVDAPLPDDVLGSSGDRQLVLAVTAEQAPLFYALLDSLTEPVVSIARH